MEPKVTKNVEADNVYYTVFWSRLKKADRYEIITKVPSVAGLFELYYQDKHKKLNLFHLSKAWYGGLRNRIRKATDPDLEEDEKKKKILGLRLLLPIYGDLFLRRHERCVIFFRFHLSSSLPQGSIIRTV